ncbi:hypothetical protein K491DRAFT_242015 [Lophiostoma macrostomum CBS 122681]|uniref:Uncharacterized protein n=1 Tax=Lophiostoma macrostomum CBS 122681 TaxID=1314788 RepID=A0A6A6SLE3_9PLEO|nr:hypothetical protein K491DRAFT_242015 [Lophiostoma macrostomum CBS 122681]
MFGPSGNSSRHCYDLVSLLRCRCSVFDENTCAATNISRTLFKDAIGRLDAPASCKELSYSIDVRWTANTLIIDLRTTRSHTHPEPVGRESVDMLPWLQAVRYRSTHHHAFDRCRTTVTSMSLITTLPAHMVEPCTLHRLGRAEAFVYYSPFAFFQVFLPVAFEPPFAFEPSF